MSGVKLGGLSFSFSANTAEYDRAMARVESAENRLAALQTSQNKEREREAAQIARLNEQIERARERSNELEAAAQSASIAKQKLIRQQLASIGSQIERNEAAIASLKKTSETNENARLAALKKMQQQTDAAAAKAATLAKRWTRVKGVMSGVGGALMGMVSVAGFKQLIDSLDALAKRAKDVGMTASQLQEFTHQAKLAGMSAGEVDSAIKSFNRNVSLAAMGTGEAQAALKKMGISLTSNSGAMKTQAQLLRETAEYFQRNAGAADNAGKAARIFGEQGAALIRIFEQGGDAVERVFNAKAIDDAAAAAERFNDSLENVSNVAFKVGAKIIEYWSMDIDRVRDVLHSQAIGTTENERMLRKLNEETARWRAGQAANERAAEAARLAAEKQYTAALDEQDRILRGTLTPIEEYWEISKKIADLKAAEIAENDLAGAAKIQRDINKELRQQVAIREQLAAQKKSKDADRAEFEMQTRLQILRAQGKDKEADAIEFARKRNELMERYGYSIQQATAAQKTLDELNKAKEGGGDTQFSDAAKKRAQKIVDRGIGGTVGKKTYEEAQAILAGKTPEEGFTTSMFSRLTADSKRSSTSLRNVNVDAKAARSQLDTSARDIEKRNGENADETNKLLKDLSTYVSIIKDTVSGIATKNDYSEQ